MTTYSSNPTRDRLIAAAEEVFAERGLDKPSLNDISERAGLTRGAFHGHFSSRDELIVAVIEKGVNAYLERYLPKCDKPEDFMRVISDFVVHAKERRSPLGPTAKLPVHQLAEVAVRSAAVRRSLDRLIGLFIDRIAEGIELARTAGLVREDANARAVARLLAMAIFGIQSVLDVGLDVTIEEVAETTLRLLAPR